MITLMIVLSVAAIGMMGVNLCLGFKGGLK